MNSRSRTPAGSLVGTALLLSCDHAFRQPAPRGPANVTAQDQFPLGADTRAMPAARMGTQVDDSVVDWTTTLAAVFPEPAGPMRPEYRNGVQRVVGWKVGR
jgi:hypothetical protein